MNTGPPEISANPEAAHTVCWLRDTMRLRFVFGGVAIYAAHLPALILDAPFNQVNADPSTPPPAPERFPEGIKALRTYACPLDPTSHVIALLPNAIRYIAAQYRHLYVHINGSFEQYLQKFSSKTRWTLRKKLKNYMASAGAEAYREYRDSAHMEPFYVLARAISAKTYQDRLLDAGIPRDQTFALRLERLAARHAVRGCLLFHGGLPVAYALCYAHGDTLTLDKTGFDPQFAQLHPGTVLTYLLIQRLFEEQQFHIFDFGSGDYEYKAFFSTGSVHCADIIYLRRTLHSLALVSAHAGLGVVSASLKRLLDVFGARAKIKKLIHARL